MTTLTEYNQTAMTTAEFEQWKASWTPDQPVPDAVHHHMQTVVLPAIDAELKEWISTF
jgi:hypothetical protein